jgi:hypothetical protein
MGLSIGQIPGSLAGLGLAGSPGRFQGLLNRPTPRTLGSPRPEGQDFALFREDPAPALRAGFGQGTISGPAAALETINQGVRNTREIVPSIQELRAELRARRSEARRANEQEPPQPREAREFRIESRLPEPSALARNFVNAVSETATANESRFSGEDPIADPARATAEFNGEQIAFGVRANTTQGRIFDGARLDISV